MHPTVLKKAIKITSKNLIILVEEEKNKELAITAVNLVTFQVVAPTKKDKKVDLKAIDKTDQKRSVNTVEWKAAILEVQIAQEQKRKRTQQKVNKTTKITE